MRGRSLGLWLTRILYTWHNTNVIHMHTSTCKSRKKSTINIPVSVLYWCLRDALAIHGMVKNNHHTSCTEGGGYRITLSTLSFPSYPSKQMQAPYTYILYTYTLNYWHHRTIHQLVCNREVSFIQRVNPVMWQPFPAAACHVLESLACTSTPWMQRGLEMFKNG